MSNIMGVATLCLCLLLCMALADGVPVHVLRADADTEAGEGVRLVKREAFYQTGRGFPCGYSAYRCPYPDLPLLCRTYDPVPCDTDFISVDI